MSIAPNLPFATGENGSRVRIRGAAATVSGRPTPAGRHSNWLLISGHSLPALVLIGQMIRTFGMRVLSRAISVQWKVGPKLIQHSLAE
jgi:hypothetical protein